MEVEGRRQRGTPKKRWKEGLHRRERGLREEDVWRRLYSEEQRPHMNMGAAAEEEEEVVARLTAVLLTSSTRQISLLCAF